MMVYSFMIATPHYLYGSGETAMSFVHANVTELQSIDGLFQNQTEFKGITALCNATASTDLEDGEKTVPFVDSYIPVMVIFFVGHFISGIADSCFWSLLLTYLDNNVSKAKAPLMHSEKSILVFQVSVTSSHFQVSAW